VEVRPRTPGPWFSSHVLSIPTYQGKIYSLPAFEVYAIQFLFLSTAYPNPHMILYPCAVIEARIELLGCVSTQDLSFTGRKGPVFWGPASGKHTCLQQGPELCSRLAWFRTQSLHTLPPYDKYRST
jgi:hypothetical protein